MTNRIQTINWQFLLLVLLIVLFGAPSRAAQNIGGGLPNAGSTGGVILNPSIPPILPLPPLPNPPNISISAKGTTWLAVALRCGEGQNVISRMQGSGSYQHLQTLNDCGVRVIRDELVEPGTSYCYRLETTFNNNPFTGLTCTTTPNERVSFTRRDITPQETERVLSEFDWLRTDVLPESPSRPILYYMNIFLDEAFGSQALRLLGAHVQPDPVFYEELSNWDEASTLVVEDDQVTGRWYYAILPGHVYNKIRERNIQMINSGLEPPLRAVVFRTIHTITAREFTWNTHRLSYQYLGEQGLEYNATPRCQIDNGVQVCQIRQELLGWLARKGLAFVAGTFRTVVEEVREGLGYFKRKIKGELDLTVQFKLMNTDELFFDVTSDELMYSGWSGEELYLKNSTVRLRQGLSSFSGKTDEFGRVTIKIAKNSNTKVCIEAANQYVKLTEFLLEKLVCVEDLGKFSGDDEEIVEVKHPYFNVLAQMTDVADYLDRVVDYEMDQVTVLVGSWATRLAVVDDRPFTSCMGRMPNLALGGGADLLGALIPGGIIAGATAEFLYSVDIVLPEKQENSRGVGAHEYGHAVMCSMLADQGILDFQIAWTDVIFATRDQHSENDTSYVIEAFAEFLTSQVVGGTNYFPPDGSYRTSYEMDYCLETTGTDLCMDKNFNETDLTSASTLKKRKYQAQVRRVATILHDVFDGHSALEAPNDGSHWEMLSGNTFLTQISGNNSVAFESENIVLDGPNLFTLFSYWDDRGNTISEDTFLGGLADLLRDVGYADFVICDLFQSHSSSSDCPQYAMGIPVIPSVPVTIEAIPQFNQTMKQRVLKHSTWKVIK